VYPSDVDGAAGAGADDSGRREGEASVTGGGVCPAEGIGPALDP